MCLGVEPLPPGHANYHPLVPGPIHTIPSSGRDRGHLFPNSGRPLPPRPGFHPAIPSSGPGVEPLPRYLTSAKVASTVCGSSGRTSCRNGRSPYAMISVFDPLTFSRTNRRWLFSFASKLNILRNRKSNVFKDKKPPQKGFSQTHKIGNFGIYFRYKFSLFICTLWC